MTTATITAQRQRLYVPTELDFGDEAYLEAEDLQALGADLIARHPDTLGHIADLTVAYLWKKTGGKRAGRPVFGKTAKRSGLVAAFTTADFIIWLAADHVEEAGYSPKQIEALLFHELNHIGWQEPDEDDPEGEGKAVLVGHEYEFFKSELLVYGAWEDMLREAADAFSQAPLFED